jgi:hypothetical protein
MTKLPSYLNATGYKNPDNYDHPPFEYIMHPDQGYGNFWHWMTAHPATHKAFNDFMGALHPQGRPPWMFGALMKRILDDFDPSRPLVVDVGGGNGTDQARVLHALPDQYHSGKIIVQDLPEVVEEAKKSPIPEQIRLSPTISLTHSQRKQRAPRHIISVLCCTIGRTNRRLRSLSTSEMR